MEVDKGEVERLAVVETKVSNIERIVLGVEQSLRKWKDEEVPRKEIEVMFEATERRIEKIESNQEWIVRAIIGGFIAGAIATVYFIIQQFIKGGP